MTDFVRSTRRMPSQRICFVFRPDVPTFHCADDWVELKPQIEAWLREHGLSPPDYRVFGQCVYLRARDEDMALAFKMRWC